MAFFKTGGGESGFVRSSNGVIYNYSSTTVEKNKSHTYSMEDGNTIYTGTITATTTSKHPDAISGSNETLTIETYFGGEWTTVATQTGSRQAHGSVDLAVSCHVKNVRGVRATIKSTDENFYVFKVTATA